MGHLVVEERFAAKVMPVIDGCHLWSGAVGGNGYGTFWKDGKVIHAHRASYEMFVGAIPIGLHIDHLCKQKLCVNPDHLEAVTQGENNRRNTRTHCRKGHMFTADNSLTAGRISRTCKTCRNTWKRRFRKD